MADYSDYHHAIAQHAAAALSNSNQLHPAMAQIPMLSAAGLNLTVGSSRNQVRLLQVMSQGLNNNNPGGQHHLGQVTPSGHHVMYQNVQSSAGSGGGGGGGGNTGHHGHQTNQGSGHGHGHGGGKKNKKPKVNKDGVPAPKRATTAYINFTQWYREELKKAGRAIPKIGDFGKECAGKWNTMAEEAKKPFLDVAARDRERYKKEMAIFKPARDANKPKRPGTAFMLFMGDFRKEMAGKEPEGGVAALAKLGGERWRNMTEDDKRPYVEKQNEEKVRYEASMEDYRKMSAGLTAVGPTPKQARLSTEGSEGGSVESDSGGASASGDRNTPGTGDIGGDGHQAQNLGIGRQQSVSTPSPATSSSSPQQQQTMSPGPQQTAGQQQQSGNQSQQAHQQQASQHQQSQSIANSNSMTPLPPISTPMSLSHAITASHASALAMAGYPQHTFANFGHPGTAAGVLAGAAAANYNSAHQQTGMGSGNNPSYLPSGATGNYSSQSHLPGHYNWS